MCRSRIGLVCVLLCVSLAGSESASASKAAVDPASVTVRELRPALVLGTDRSSWLMRLSIRVGITNQSSSPILVESRQFILEADGKAVAEAASESGENFRAQMLAPSESVEGWLWYGGIPLAGEEVPLKLLWRGPQAANSEGDAAPVSLTIDLNTENRRLNKVEKLSIGPGGELQLIRVQRTLDALAVWALRETLEETAKSGIERILFAPAAETTPMVSDEFSEWLAGLIEGYPTSGMQQVRVSLPRLNIRFKHASLAEFKENAGRSGRSGRRWVMHYRSVEDAVCASLTPLYRFVNVEQAITDLRNSDPGIRRAAMAGAVDRLTAKQAEAILEQAQTGTENVQLEVASYLHLIPGEGAVETLKELSLGENRKVAAVAMRSLVRSRDDAAESALAEIWNVGGSSPSIQSELVQAIVEVADERWVSLVADYLASYLRQAVQPDGSSLPGESIAGALEFLHRQNDMGTLILVRQQIPQIQSPVVQDIFLQHLLQMRLSENEQAIRACVSKRLNDSQYSGTVAAAAAAYRDSAWTDALMNAFTLAKNDNRNAPQFLNAALECASSPQLDAVAASFDTFDINQKLAVLQHLARANHPQWRSVAAGLLESPGARSAEVVPLLAQDASEESLSMLRSRLEAYVAKLEGTPDASVEGQHYFQTLISHLAMFVHPECRRILNRMSRSSNTYVRERVIGRQADAERRSPGYHLLLAEARLRQAGDLASANQALDDCIDLNPLFPRAYVQRSSVSMHAGRFEDSMRDLETADRLSPEDVDVQSMMALVMVRQNRIDEGLKFAEQVIAMAPLDWTSLYNGACTYARAAESPGSAADSRTMYAARAIELLKQTAELKFSDSEHMLQDSDLRVLHDHSEWETVVKLVNANKPPAPETPQEDR